jgi:hypothetical protein
MSRQGKTAGRYLAGACMAAGLMMGAALPVKAQVIPPPDSMLLPCTVAPAGDVIVFNNTTFTIPEGMPIFYTINPGPLEYSSFSAFIVPGTQGGTYPALVAPPGTTCVAWIRP